MKDGGCEKEAGRMKFAIETVEIKGQGQGHCSAGKTICESERRKEISGKEIRVFIVREGTEWRDGVRPILPAAEHCL
jgi:hypothetical protein